MLDKRLLNGDVNAIEFNERMITAGNCEAEDWFLDAVKTLELWMENFVGEQHCLLKDNTVSITEAAKLLNRAQLPGKLLASVNGVPANLVEGVDALLQETKSDDISEWVFGTALAEAMMKCSENPHNLVALWELSDYHYLAKVKLKQHCSVILRGNSVKASSFLDSCDLIVKHFKENIGSSIRPHHNDTFMAGIEALKKNKSFFNTASWEAVYGQGFNDFPLIGIIDITRGFDKKKYIDILEEIEIPQVLSIMFFNTEISKSLDEQLEILDAAVSRSEPNNSSVIPMILSEIEASIMMLNNQNKDKSSKALNEDILRLISPLVNMSEKRLSYYWLVSLISKDDAVHNADEANAGYVNKIIECLSKELMTQDLDFHSFLKYFEELSFLHKEQKTRLSMVMYGFYALSGVFVDEKLNDEIRSELLTIYESTLLNSDYGLRTDYSGTSIGYGDYNPGLIFAKNETCLEDWNRTWNSLLVKRRGRLFYAYSKGSYETSPDLTLAYAGLAAIEWLVSDQIDNSKNKLELFTLLLKLSIRKNELHFQDEWKYFIMNLFARLPYIVQGPDSESVYRDCLIELGGDNELVVGACDSLKRNGVDMDVIRHALPSVEVTLNSYIAWLERDGGKKAGFNLSEQAIDMLKA